MVQCPKCSDEYKNKKALNIHLGKTHSNKRSDRVTGKTSKPNIIHESESESQAQDLKGTYTELNLGTGAKDKIEEKTKEHKLAIKNDQYCSSLNTQSSLSFDYKGERCSLCENQSLDNSITKKTRTNCKLICRDSYNNEDDTNNIQNYTVIFFTKVDSLMVLNNLSRDMLLDLDPSNNFKQATGILEENETPQRYNKKPTETQQNIPSTRSSTDISTIKTEVKRDHQYNNFLMSMENSIFINMTNLDLFQRNTNHSIPVILTSDKNKDFIIQSNDLCALKDTNKNSKHNTNSLRCKFRAEKKPHYNNDPEENLNKYENKRIKNRYQISCINCDFQTTTNKLLINHYNNTHHYKITTHIHFLKNIDELNIWKKNFLKTEHYTFISTSTNKNIEYFKCNFIHENKRKCTAFITITKTKKSTYVIKYFLFHAHDPDWDQITVTPQTKEYLICKMTTGVSLAKLFIELRSTIDGKITKKSQTITLNYLHYLKTLVERINYLDNNDYKSFIKLKDKFIQNKEVIQICFKEINSKNEEYNLKNEEYVFAFSTKEMLNKYKEYNSKGILIDSTHSTNNYSFPLVVGLIISDIFEAFPFIFIICSSEREEVLKYVFSNFKAVFDKENNNNNEEILKIEHKNEYLISDMYPGFYNAWDNIFENNSKHIFCDFHVKKCWKKNIYKFIKNKDHQKIIVEYLHEISITTNEEKFKKIIKAFIETLKKINTKFYNYFKTYYYNKMEKWGLPFRKECYFNTNNFAESFFKTLKYRYLERKTNNRIDMLFIKLINVSKMIINESLVRESSKKITNYTFRMNKSKENHNKITTYKKEDFEKIETNKYKHKNYIITNSKTYNTYEKTKIICPQCYIHFDEFTCDCLNFLQTKQICKHIHAVAQFYFLDAFKIRATSSFNSTCHSTYDSLKLSLNEPEEKFQTNIVSSEKCVSRNTSLCSDYTDTVSTLDDQLASIKLTASKLPKFTKFNDKIDECLDLIRSYSYFGTIKNSRNGLQVNPYKIVVKQKDLECGGMKERGSKFRRLSKKRGPKVKKIIKSFVLCNSCFFMEDQFTSEKIDWVGCLLCEKWFHSECVKGSMNGKNNIYICCRN